MNTTELKQVTIYLTDWQMRMVKDVLGLDCDRWTVQVDAGPVMRYFVHGAPGLDPSARRMYLTDCQMREIKDLTNESCTFVELKSGIRMLYMGPPAQPKV